MRLKNVLFITTAITLALAGGAAIAISLPKFDQPEIQTPQVDKKDNVFIEADQMDYDSEKNLVTATGHVEILKGENVLFADKVTYDKNTDVATADGNVSAVGAEGNALFTSHMVMKGDMSAGVINFFRTRLSDGSLLAAARATRINENVIKLHKAVYSPCPICTQPKADGTIPAPQWQIKANTAILDNTAQEVVYRDATFDLYGIPILYTPYFSHGTPGAPAESGFLMPNIRTDKNLGLAVTTPYYWSIAPNIDFTADPVFTTKEGPVLAGQFRHLTPYGSYELFGSITRPNDIPKIDETYNDDVGKWRGHLKGDGQFDLSEHWDIGFDGEVASDDTYLKRYNYERNDLPSSLAYTSDLLTSKAYAERIDNRDYTSVQAVYFQGLLQQDNASTIPLGAPYVQSHVESRKGILPGFNSSVLWGDFSGFAIRRDDGDNNQRMSASTGITIPLVIPGGQFLQIDGALRGDQYYLQDTSPDTANENEAHRIIPQVSATWRYPLMNQISDQGHILLEPIVKLLLSPNHNYNKGIPDEDSQDVEFSDLNLFDDNRFRGLDRIESGARLYYGLRGGYYQPSYNITYLVGQDYRLGDPPKDIPSNSGIDHDLSDIVGRVGASINDVFDISYKFRFDEETLRARRNEIDATLNMKDVKFSVSYFKLDYDFVDTTNNREEINATTQFKVADQYSLLFGGQRNLAQEQQISASTGLLYEGDCTNVLTTVRKDFLSDRDARSGVAVTFQLGLKNLGNL